MKRVLFICKLRGGSYGIPYGLFNSASFVAEALKKRGIETKVVDVVDANSIDREVSQYKPTHVVIEALWVTPDKFRVLLKLHKKPKWVVRVHSKAPFLAMEGIAIEWLTEYKKIADEFNNFKVSANNFDFNNELIDVLRLDAVYLPNIYAPKYQFKPSKCKETFDIGCFGSIRPLKNQFIQAIAAIDYANLYGKKLQFHMNASRVEQRGESILRNIRALFKDSGHILVEHQWLSHADFIKLVRTMDLGMQVSFTESFNIVTADFVSQDVPVVVSPDIDWMPLLYKANSNSSESMVRALRRAELLGLFNIQIVAMIKLWWHSRKAIKTWLSYLNSCI